MIAKAIFCLSVIISALFIVKIRERIAYTKFFKNCGGVYFYAEFFKRFVLGELLEVQQLVRIVTKTDRVAIGSN